MMTLFPDDIITIARSVVRLAASREMRIALAESCTGGLVCGALTEISGSSKILDHGWVTYANTAKEADLGVSADLLEEHGAVSGEVAEAMAAGALERSGADMAVAITGVAGPSGGTPDKPVGLVWFGLARKDRPTKTLECRFGDQGRAVVRLESVRVALNMFSQALHATS